MTLLVRPMRKTGECSEQNSNKNQNSDVSFQEDEDEEIDKCEKEVDRIEFMERSTKEAEDHMKNTLLDRNTQKAEVEDGNENCVSTHRTLDKQCCRLEPWSGHQDQSKQISWKTKKCEDDINQRVLEDTRNRRGERKRNEK